MKKFQTVKVTFEAYISTPSNQDMSLLTNKIGSDLEYKMEMYCTDNAFGLTDCNITLEQEND